MSEVPLDFGTYGTKYGLPGNSGIQMFDAAGRGENTAYFITNKEVKYFKQSVNDGNLNTMFE